MKNIRSIFLKVKWNLVVKKWKWESRKSKRKDVSYWRQLKPNINGEVGTFAERVIAIQTGYLKGKFFPVFKTEEDKYFARIIWNENDILNAKEEFREVFKIECRLVNDFI